MILRRNALWLRGRQGRRLPVRAFLIALAGAVLTAAGVAGPASAAPTAPPPGHGFTPGSAVVGTTAVFAYTATDGSAWVRDLANGVYSPAGGHLTSGLAAIGSGSSVLIFGRGTDNALWVNSCTPGGGCGSWASLGGAITAGPGAVFRGPATADYSVYARGTDGAVWGRDHSSSGWGAWHSLGGALLGGTGPAAAFLGHTYLLAVGLNGILYLKEVGVTGFVAVRGLTSYTPALTALPSALVGFAQGTDGLGYYHRFLATSPDWHPMGGALTSGLSAATQNATTTLTFGLGKDNQVYENTGTWTTYPPAFGGWKLVS